MGKKGKIKMIFLVVIVSCLSLSAGVEGVGKEKSCVRSKKIDLQLIIDSSKSVGQIAFHLMLHKISDRLLEKFDIGQDGARVALFKYSSNNVMVNEFGLNSYHDISSLKKAISEIKYQPGYTNTAQAMFESLRSFKEEMRQDQHTTKVCIVFTDGQANDRSQTPAASKAWRDEGVSVIAVGIGEGINMEGLAAISGSKTRALRAKSYLRITDIIDSLLVKICKEIPAHSCDTSENGGCEQICHKRGDDSYCSCEDGFRLAKNKRSCVKGDIDLKEVEFSGGVAEATNYLDMKWVPSNAFKRQTRVGTGWHIGKPFHINEPTSLPVLIWYDFVSRKVVPSELSFQPAESGGATQGAPSSYQFIGSNAINCDDDSEWTILCEDLSDRIWRSQFEVRYCKVNQTLISDASPEQRGFRCLGIRALKNRRGDGWTSIRNIRMWKEIDIGGGAKDEL